MKKKNYYAVAVTTFYQEKNYNADMIPLDDLKATVKDMVGRRYRFFKS